MIEGPFLWLRYFPCFGLTHPAPAGTAMRGSVHADLPLSWLLEMPSKPSAHDLAGTSLHALVVIPAKCACWGCHTSIISSHKDSDPQARHTVRTVLFFMPEESRADDVEKLLAEEKAVEERKNRPIFDL